MTEQPDSLVEPGSAMDDSDHADGDGVLRTSAFGSGLLARQPTPEPDETVAIAKVCPQCSSEYETGDRFCPKDGSPLRPKSGDDPLVGRVIADRYLVLARLGEGGMGRVYLAEHVKMARQCAIKVMNPALMNDSQSLARFAREASNAARIIHPNVAAVFDFGESDRIVYLVMEYVDGESLSALLACEGSLDARRSIAIARQIADGLAAAHELGIVHRDLKPDNVIITRARAGREIPKVVDFGIAKALSDSPADALTRSGLVIGTPEYMSPEQLLGDPVDPRSDIFSLGCILYQMLTGSQPFAADTREQMIRRRLNEAPPHVRDVLPDLPRRLDTLLVHMLARAPNERIASAASVRDALDPALVLEGWDPASLSEGELAWTTSSGGIDLSLQPTVPMPRQRRPRTRAAAVVVISAAALAGVLTLTPRFEEKTPAPVAAPLVTPPDSTILSMLPPVAAPLPAAPVVVAKSPARKAPPAAPKVDSAASAAANKQKLAAITTEEEAIKAPLERFRAASARGDLVALADAVPSISETQRLPFAQIYETGSDIHSTLRMGEPVVSGDSAEVPVTLVVTYLEKKSKTLSSVRLSYQAVLARLGAAWSIAELRNNP